MDNTNSQNNNKQQLLENITATYRESMSMVMDSEDVLIQERLSQRKALADAERTSARVGFERAASTWQAQFNLTQPIGITLAQVSVGRKLSNAEWDMDQQMQVPRSSAQSSSQQNTNNGFDDNRQCMDWPSVAGRVRDDWKGILVASVLPDSPAWRMGVRAGDQLQAVSATLGDQLWPTSTLDGIQSALRSRKVTSGTISFEFTRLEEDVVIATNMNRYELTLQRPLGIEVQENEKDGSVVVTGFSESASNLVRHAVQLGDRVVAVDSSWGDTLWPVTTVDGLTSACTSRLPGAPIRLQLERPLENMKTQVDYSAEGMASPAVNENLQKQKKALESDAATAVAQNQEDEAALLQRCRDVLVRYSAEKTEKAGFKGKFNVPAIVADKVVDALASAQVSLDSKTLSMIMKAYLSCERPDSAIRVFEAATGFRADGTCLSVIESLIGSNGGGFIRKESALNLYTGTALLQAHAMKGDLYSVSRVLAALEGRSGVLVNGLESAPWPFTGVYGSIQPDTKCYNIAIAAAARTGGEEGLEMALAIFDTMANSEEESNNNRKPVRNVVSYNTVINALGNAGRTVDAFRMFDRMQTAKIRPTKFTYTPLIKSCLNDGDIEELLYDMREKNIQADTVTYNTVIRSLCEKKRWTEASKLVTEMERSGVLPDSKTYGYLMAAMLKADKPTACLTLFESACSSSKTAPLTENVYLYTTAITAASVLKDYDRAVDLLSRMTAKGVKPNIKTLTSVMGACLAANKPDLAAQIYQKIEQPDGYAMSQGIEAMSRSGDFDRAFAILSGQKNKVQIMKGKQIMQGYQTLIVSALKERDFDMAEKVFADLLRKGYIPNKIMLGALTDVLGFNERRGMVSFALEDEEDKDQVFRFVLFVLDSLHKRNLPVESHFYSVVLFLGRTIGGKARTVSSLIAQSKVSEQGEQILRTDDASQDSSQRQTNIDSWVELFDKLDQLDGLVQRDGQSRYTFPEVQVRMSDRDRRRLVRAETEVALLKSAKRRKRQNSEALTAAA